MSRIISQLSVQHAAVNYELVDYITYAPNLPTKLYNDTRVNEGEFSFHRLPNRLTSSVSSFFFCIISFVRKITTSQKKQAKQNGRKLFSVQFYKLSREACEKNDFRLGSLVAGSDDTMPHTIQLRQYYEYEFTTLCFKIIKKFLFLRFDNVLNITKLFSALVWNGSVSVGKKVSRFRWIKEALI